VESDSAGKGSFVRGNNNKKYLVVSRIGTEEEMCKSLNRNDVSSNIT
jgi:hypothetical protein